MRCSTSELTAHLGGELVGPGVSIEGASIDSRTIRPGELYAPIAAERDGHAFIPAALEAGAPAYLTAQDPPGRASKCSNRPVIPSGGSNTAAALGVGQRGERPGPARR
jgi:UDP-N-acetylmuramyl pentapeptide synthase